jgi:hypothetical protein
MPSAVVLFDILKENPDAGVMFMLSLYLAYEIRYGRMDDLRQSQQEAARERRIIGVALYRVLKGDPNLDEENIRDLLWSENDGDIFPNDFVASGDGRGKDVS